MKTVNGSKNKRDLIIQASVKLFAEQGYYHTRMGAIAKAVGLCQSSLYHYVRGKKQLIQQIINNNMARMDRVIEISESKLAPKEKLRELIKYYVTFSTENAYEAKILFTQTNVLPSKMQRTVHGKKKHVEHALQQVLKDGINQGEFLLKLEDVKVTSFAILGICHWTFLWYRPGGELTTEQIANKLISLLEKPLLIK